MFAVRDDVQIARIQFALAGVNAHINHDLAQAIVTTCQAIPTGPHHVSPQYNDYTALNTTLDSIIEPAKQSLNVRLLGDALPAVSHLEDSIAAWGTAAAREQAWNHSENLWFLRDAPAVVARYMDGLDRYTALVGNLLLVPVP